MLKVNTYSSKGTKTTPTTLPRDMEAEINLILLAQAIRVYENRRHSRRSNVKGRSDVVASKKKIWAQKGSGRARHGAVSAPLFVGGGKAFGPKGARRILEMPKAMRNKALKVAISKKVNEGKLIVVSGAGSLRKTKEGQNLINKISKAEKLGGKKFTFFLAKENKDSLRAIRNLENAKAVSFGTMNAHQIYFGGVVVFDKDALKAEREDGGKK